MKRVAPVISRRAFAAQPLGEGLAREGHVSISMPSSAISQPAAPAAARSAESSRKSGFELLRWMKRRRRALAREPARLVACEERLLVPERAPRHLSGEALQRTIEAIALDEAAADTPGSIDPQRVRLAQREKAEAMIEVAVGEHDARDR